MAAVLAHPFNNFIYHKLAVDYLKTWVSFFHDILTLALKATYSGVLQFLKK